MKKRKNKRIFESYESSKLTKISTTTTTTDDEKIVNKEVVEVATSSSFCCGVSEDANDLKEFRFELATYNILAPALAEENSYLYTNVPNDFMDWNYRRSKIFDEVKFFDFDVRIFR